MFCCWCCCFFDGPRSTERSQEDPGDPHPTTHPKKALTSLNPHWKGPGPSLTIISESKAFERSGSGPGGMGLKCKKNTQQTIRNYQKHFFNVVHALLTKPSKKHHNKPANATLTNPTRGGGGKTTSPDQIWTKVWGLKLTKGPRSIPRGPGPRTPKWASIWVMKIMHLPKEWGLPNTIDNDNTNTQSVSRGIDAEPNIAFPWTVFRKEFTAPSNRHQKTIKKNHVL